MKTVTLNICLSLVLLLGMSACSKEEEGATTTTLETIELTHGMSVTCSDASSFSLSPQEGTQPDVTVVKNTTTGATTLTYNSISGSATLEGCSKIE